MKQLSIYDLELKLPEEEMKLVQLQKRVKYTDGKPTDDPDGYALTVMLPSIDNALLSAKVDQVAKHGEVDLRAMPLVALEDVTVKPYTQGGRIALSVHAKKAIVG